MKTNTVVRKIETVVEARVRDMNKIDRTVEKIKHLRRRCNGFNSVKEIRKWRER